MRIAVVGSGVAGLTAAHLLSQKHDVFLFEKNPSIGGHTATVDVEVEGVTYAVDTGFIVFNDRTYPLFRALMRELGVTWKDTQMSFSVQNPNTGLEYNGHTLGTLFAQKRNLLRPSFYRFLGEIVRFNKAAKAALEDTSLNVDEMTLDAFVAELGLSDTFKQNYLYPMCAAIWSASLNEAAQFPLGFFLRFFMNHGLLNVSDRPQWAVINGGSRTYIEPLTARFRENIQVNAHIEGISRTGEGVKLRFVDGTTALFDELVLACHSDQALALLEDPSPEEQAVLSAIPYQANDVVLHTDINQLPKARAAWASWNYLLPIADADYEKPATVTYNMNILQGIESSTTFCVTLNNTAALDGSKILRRFTYHHPVYSVASFAARQQRNLICGKNHTHFAGAYWYSGFHEDGVRSANDLAARFEVDAIQPKSTDGVAHG
ncbi:MAG: FAD-dependent oxidoreductase [Idiomarina sp.]|nr:FAD-dependent oxidoreductase [Idiomarina sp.]